MSLHILYGSALSGRAEKLYDTVFERAERFPARNFIVLVPEQASLTVQQALIERSPRHALLNIDVLTFNRLCFRVFEETGEKGRDILDDIGKSMLLRLVVGREQKELTALRRNLKRKGFIDELKSLMSELAQYNVSPELLGKSAEKLSDFPLLQAKARDVAHLYGEFLNLLHENYEMAEERLARLAACIRRWERAADTEIVLEGFTGFTPPQYEVLSAMITHCPEVYLGAVMGTGRSAETEKDKSDLFYMSAHMAEECKALAIGQSVPYEEATLADSGAESRFSPEIRHIERVYGVYPQVEYPEHTDRITVTRCRNREEETGLILSKVLEVIRNGCRYRDMAIICGDPASYRELLEARFGEANIPLFIDSVKPLTANPLLQLLTASIGVCCRDFAREDVVAVGKNPIVIRFLQCSLTPGDRLTPYERVCELENFLLATGLRGRKAYGKTWSSRSKKFAEIRKTSVNETKALLGTPLLSLDAGMRGEEEDTTVSEKIAALRTFFEAVSAQETMKAFAEDYEREGEFLLSREYENTYELLSGLFDRAEELLGDRRMDCEEFSEVMETGLEKLGIGLIPPTKDRLVVGDLERTRLGEIKKLFILGANEGALPKARQEGGLFSDADREILEERDLELAPTAREESFNQQFYIYLLLTKPSESVFATWSSMDAKGKALLRSPLAETLETLFPDRKAENTGSLVVNSRAGGLRALAAGLRDARKEGREPDPMILALRSWFASDPRAVAGLTKIAAGMEYRYKKEVLPREMARKLFGERMNGSATELEKFAGCAFAHFLNFGLELQERDEHEVTGADIGTLLHDSVDLFFRKLRMEGLSWVDLTDEKLEALSEECVLEVAEDYGDDLLSDNARNSYLVERVKRLTRRTLYTLRYQWQQGSFTESLTEESFYGSREMPELCLQLGNGLSLALRGRIDRLDLADDGSKVYVKVIDYKSGSTTLDYTRIYYGLQLQLLLYMEAAKAIVRKRCPDREIVPVGFYYYHFDDPIVEDSEKKTPEQLILDELRMKGLTNSDVDAVGRIDEAAQSGQSTVVHGLRKTKEGFAHYSAVASSEEMEELGAFALRKAESLAGEILAGNIDIRPKSGNGVSSCTYCRHRGVCGFDERIDGFRRTEMSKRFLADLLEKNGEEGAQNG